MRVGPEGQEFQPESVRGPPPGPNIGGWEWEVTLPWGKRDTGLQGTGYLDSSPILNFTGWDHPDKRWGGVQSRRTSTNGRRRRVSTTQTGPSTCGLPAVFHWGTGNVRGVEYDVIVLTGGPPSRACGDLTSATTRGPVPLYARLRTPEEQVVRASCYLTPEPTLPGRVGGARRTGDSRTEGRHESQ